MWLKDGTEISAKIVKIKNIKAPLSSFSTFEWFPKNYIYKKIWFNILEYNAALSQSLKRRPEHRYTLTAISGSATNWKALRENLRVLFVWEMNWDIPGTLLLSSRQLLTTTTIKEQQFFESQDSTAKPISFESTNDDKAHPELSITMYFWDDPEPLAGTTKQLLM